jgi:S-adenosylmethionine synthetase
LAPFEHVVRKVGKLVGYANGNAVDASRWAVRDNVQRFVADPREWSHHVSDQAVVIGYAGYDAQTRYLPPEHHLAHVFRASLTCSCRIGDLKGQGPDGKLLVRMREEGDRWILEHVLVTLQQLGETSFVDLCQGVSRCIREAYRAEQNRDRRWVRNWEDVELLINPNGPLVGGGPTGDNGQTGRKLVMDFYGPRVPIGGGALSGKDLTHIDRAGAYAARRAALAVVSRGAHECLVRVAYAPNVDQPLEVSSGSGRLLPEERRALRHSAIRTWLDRVTFSPGWALGEHFLCSAPWNCASTSASP